MEIDYADMLPTELWNQIFEGFAKSEDFPTLAAVYHVSKRFRDIVDNILKSALASKQKVNDLELTSLRAFYNYKIAHIDPARNYTTILVHGEPQTIVSGSCPMLICHKLKNLIQITKLTKYQTSFTTNCEILLKFKGRYIWRAQNHWSRSISIFNELDELKLSNAKGITGGMNVEGNRYLVQVVNESLKIYTVEKKTTKLTKSFSLKSHYKTFHIVCKKKKSDQIVLTNLPKKDQFASTRQLFELENNNLKLIKEFNLKQGFIYEYISINELSYAISKQNDRLKNNFH